MGYTVAELLERISSEELTEWMAFYQLEPFGDERADVRSASICQTMANIHRGRDHPGYKLEEFMPFREKKQLSGKAFKKMFAHREKRK